MVARRHRALLTAAAVGLLVLGGCSTDSVLDLKVGDCLHSSDLDASQVTSAKPAACSESHDAEIFSEHTFADGDYPGEDAVQDEAEAACRDRFAEFVGLPYDDSDLYFTMLYPTEQSWKSADDRSALCILLADEPVTESLESAGR